MKEILDQILDKSDFDNIVYSSEKSCFIFDEVYKAKATSAKPLFFSDKWIKKSVTWRVQNIIGTLLKQAIQNEEKSLYKILFRVQYLLHRIQTKLFGQGKVIESNPQGYALYATKK